MLDTDYYSEELHGPHQYLELGDFELQTGMTLPNAKLAYKTHGTLNEAKDNAILFPHMYSGTPRDMETRFVGEARPLDPSKYFIILPGHAAVPGQAVRDTRATAAPNAPADRRAPAQPAPRAKQQPSLQSCTTQIPIA